jgi:hypothetical protein
MSQTGGEPNGGKGLEQDSDQKKAEQTAQQTPITLAKTTAIDKEEDYESLDPSQRKFKAAALRKEALDLDASAQELRTQAIEKEKEAAVLRIKAWKVEGAISAVSKKVIESKTKDKYEKELAELDLMAADWIDSDTVSRHHQIPTPL